MRGAATSVRLRLADALDELTGRGDPLIPPRRLNFVGDSDFRSTGDEFLGHFRSLGGLKASDRVLDIGCGIGRMARVLVPVLRAPPGSYDGFDVSQTGIDWCRAHYPQNRAPFRFKYVDIHHPEYNPRGSGDAEHLRFPYDDASFDLAIATSVFTHLLDGAVTHYLQETVRVLAPGGRLFCTWLVVDPDLPPVAEQARYRLHKTSGAALVGDPAAPEAVVAYPLQWLREQLRAAGLTLREPYEPGTWTGRGGTSLQDLLVADRVA
ncbi:MAG: class I SAM-dependent methyltransferase [Solirubrobacteraceae bacterium]